ncbi:MAG: hypothetical protein P4L84_02865 [Isosphaeraceae bacterium]|nr:hypothetical protein [Isosphaeraceae bacterium]
MIADIIAQDSRGHDVLVVLVKGFLSENGNDFGQRDVNRALESVGVKYFRRTEAALGWLRSQAGG